MSGNENFINLISRGFKAKGIDCNTFCFFFGREAWWSKYWVELEAARQIPGLLAKFQGCSPNSRLLAKFQGFSPNSTDTSAKIWTRVLFRENFGKIEEKKKKNQMSEPGLNIITRSRGWRWHHRRRRSTAVIGRSGSPLRDAMVRARVRMCVVDPRHPAWSDVNQGKKPFSGQLERKKSPLEPGRQISRARGISSLVAPRIWLFPLVPYTHN